MRLLAFITLLLLLQIEAKTQPKAIIRINKGSHVDFNFNKFADFDILTGGIELIGYTQIEVYFEDKKGLDGLGINHGGWRLEFSPDPSDFLTSYFNRSGPSINIIEFQIIQTYADPGINFVPVGGFKLDGSGPTEIANQTWVGADGVTFTAKANYTINYYCNKSTFDGIVENLGNYVNDTYFVELNFSLYNIP